ncbi:MAG TPA: aromatic-ring-hydroxylating dioxygenase subunit beta [Burkholderiaceae bacterium]|jgi:ethylbenzene dioxygenase subunit beta|nr:aromatic-ring-hydroxylating dioxygenase subunit beta [Burkholderiaceae bacterium]
MNDDGRYVTPELYRRIEAFVERMRARADPPDLPQDDRARVARFMYHEARLLDARHYQAWFALTTEDFAYWVPSRFGSASLSGQVAVNFDDRRRMLDRIAYADQAAPAAQTPPSRTARIVANVDAWRGEAADTIEVAAKLAIHEYRRQRMNLIAGTQWMILRAGADGYRIQAKVIELLDCDEPQGNNSFIL